MSELFRDARGVPHLRARTELELARAQGRVTAVDRGWQIEVERWRVDGRLAERIGPAGVPWDRFARQARLADTARAAYDALDALDADDRAWVAAYANGVSDGLASGGRDRAEFAALHGLNGDEPVHEPWPAWMPLGIFLSINVLFSTMPSLLWRQHVANTLGDAHVDVFAVDGGPGSGSNAWAVHGSRTASGRPLLAGDPHRLLELPGVYQQVRLACDEYDVVGLALPGVPGVQHFGHAGRVAWGITNAMAHSADLYAERLRRDGDGFEALGPQGWEAVDAHVERVVVRGARPIDLLVLETARGPVVVDGPSGAYSLRLPARVDADLGFAALRPLLRSRSAADVVEALGAWVDPVNRIVAADIDGHVLRWTAGRVPDLPLAERRLPRDAATDAPPPVRSSPPAEEVTDVAVDANEHPFDRPDHALGYVYAPAHRARRIRAMLDARTQITAEDCEAVHADVRAGGVDALIALLDGVDADTCSGAAQRLRTLVLDWNRLMDADSPGAGAFAAWRSALVQRVAAQPSLAALHRPHGFGPIFDPWCSVTVRVGDALSEILGYPPFELDAPALAAAAAEGAAAAGPAEWGATHRLHALHLLAEVPGAVAPASPEVALGGDTDSVRCTASLPGVSDLSWRGSVARWIWDLADRDASRWIVPFGASGDPRSPHFTDQTEAWAAVRTDPVTTDWSTMTREDETWTTT